MNLWRVKTFVQKFKNNHGQVWIDKSNWLLLVNHYEDYFLEKKKMHNFKQNEWKLIFIQVRKNIHEIL
jgi:hypothetical protein